MLLPTLSLNSLVLPLLQPKTHYFYLPVSSLKIFPSSFHQLTIFVSLSFFFPESSLAKCIFPFMMQKLRGSLYWYIYSHQKGNILFWGCILSSCHRLVGKQNKTKQRKTRLSSHWSLFNELLHKITGKEPSSSQDSEPKVKNQWLFNKEIHFQVTVSTSRKWMGSIVEHLRMEI